MTSSDWLKPLEDAVAGMTAKPWEAQEPSFCPNFGKAKIWPLKIVGKIHNHPVLLQKDAEGITLLRNHAELLLGIVRAADEFQRSYDVNFEVQGGLYGRPMQTISKGDVLGSLRATLNALRTALEKK